jgi:hypothetical protein
MRGSAAFRTAIVPGGVLAGPWVKNELWRRAKAVPSLDLRFADNKSLVDAVTGQNLVTFTRASSGTYVGSDGLIKTAVTDAPRFDHNPTTGESLGLLVEEQRTNLLLQSNQFDTTWTNNNSSETASAGTAPDRTNTAWELKDTLDAVSTAHALTQTISFTTGVAYTFTCWMKAGTLTQGGFVLPSAAFTTAINCRVNLVTGAVLNSSAALATSTTLYANGWIRVTATATATATASGTVSLRPMDGAASYIGTGSGTILIWGAQAEAGAFPTSYIPTTTATVTRSADVASISGSNFSSWYRQDEGTLFAEATSNQSHGGTNQFPRIASLSDGTTATRIDLVYRVLSTYTDAGYSVVDSNVSQASFDTNRQSNGTRLSVGYQINNFAFAQAGSILSGATDNSGTVPVVNQLSIGRRSGTDLLLTGTIKRLTYWPTRLSNSTLQAVTQ